jgi:hypothetical protein
MLRISVIGIVVAFAASSHAEPAPESHATGTWLELAIDSNLGASGVDDLPSHRLVIGGQGDRVAVGVALGFQYVTQGSSLRFDIGPTARLTLAATPEHDTELVGEGGLLLSSFSGDSGPSNQLYTFQAGLEVRHWLDRHLAIGGGILGHVEVASTGTNTAIGVGASGALRVTGVF